MTIKVLMTPDGKKVVINTEKDVCLYSAPHNPPNTGTTYTRGTDLYAHKARSGNIYYYYVHWSMWQGEQTSYELISREEAEKFLLKKASLGGWAGLDEEDFELLKEHGFDLLQEDA